MSVKRKGEKSSDESRAGKAAKVEKKGYVIGHYEIEDGRFREDENKVLIIGEDKKLHSGEVKNSEMFDGGCVVKFVEAKSAPEIKILDRCASKVNDIEKVSDEVGKTLDELINYCELNISFYDSDGSVSEFLEQLLVYAASGIELESDKKKKFQKLTFYSVDSTESVQLTVFGEASMKPGVKVVHNFTVDKDDWNKHGVVFSDKKKSVCVVHVKGAKLPKTPHVKYVERNLSVIPINKVKSLSEFKTAIDHELAKNPAKANQTFEAKQIDVEVNRLKVRFNEEFAEVYGVAFTEENEKILLKRKMMANLLKEKNLKIPESFQEFKRSKKKMQQELKSFNLIGDFTMFYSKKGAIYTMTK